MSKTSEQAAPLLIELGCEELPAGQIDSQLRQLSSGLSKHLEEAGFIVGQDKPQTFATPRRLAVLFPGIRARQADQVVERKGPAESSAFDAKGQPTKAALGFAKSVNLEVDDLERLENEQGRWLFARVHRVGLPLADCLPEMLETTTRGMAGARSMRWSDRSERFLRPVRWIVALHGEKTLPLEAFGLSADRTTRGHRIHAPGLHSLADARDYAAVLRHAFVEPEPEKRRLQIKQGARQLAQDHGLDVVIDDLLLQEVAGLTEWPQPVLGHFDKQFLEVPAEALISSMQQHQKCFPLRDSKGELAPCFIAVANIESLDVPAMTAGFERVIRPRLADARFFYEQDRRVPLADRRERLSEVKFQEKMGSVADKTARLQLLVAALADWFGADRATVRRAAVLSKCDLLTEMVGEFPELQGVMGRYYALADGETHDVALALESHYLPRHAGDHLPAEPSGQVLALADRLDTILGVFAAGQKPKGGKDPFALRRAALGIVRILEASGVSVPIREMLNKTAEAFESITGDRLPISKDLIDEVDIFITERLKSHATEAGLETNTVSAVAANSDIAVAEFMSRCRAVQAFADDPQAESLIAANKRIANLLRQADQQAAGPVTVRDLVEPAEKELAEALVSTTDTLGEVLAHKDYAAALSQLARLKAPVDRFFDEVMVMVDDQDLRSNRLSLLSSV
ncbi:MAG TPA: glycine--tRNA ligase subunit beta, partial [Wenzhouxiangella sp.]|nr:glycine--tRNA ligase subunit beta [Wenzhouxiangella sp.]